MTDKSAPLMIALQRTVNAPRTGNGVAASWLVSVGAAASVGVLSPILTYWVSTGAGNAQGWDMGKQTSAASLGVTVGSAAGGLLFNISGARGTSFVQTAGLVTVGLVQSLGLSRHRVIM